MSENEPVRLGGWTAVAVGCGLVSAVLWATGADLRQTVAVVGIMLLTSIGGLEWARAHVTPYRDG